MADGYDCWDQSIWACADDDSDECTRRERYENASGVQIPKEILDEYVVLRFFELVAENTANDVLGRVIAKYHHPLVDECADQMRILINTYKLEAPRYTANSKLAMGSIQKDRENM